MQRRAFGRTGVQAPVLGFGARQPGDPRLPEEHAARLLNHARRRCALSRPEFDCIVGDGDWESLALRFAAYAPGVDCVIVGGTDPRHLDRNKAAAAAGPLEPGRRDAIREAFARVGADWQGQI